MKIQWEEEALNDLENIRFYIGKDNPRATLKMVKQITQSVKGLTAQPLMGRPGRIPNTRELVMSNIPYIVPYMASQSVISVLRILHISRQWPKMFPGKK